MGWLLALPGKLKLYGLAFLAGVAALGVLYLKARGDGVAAMKSEQDKARLKAIEDRKQSDENVDHLGAADVDRELVKWLRDTPKR